MELPKYPTITNHKGEKHIAKCFGSYDKEMCDTPEWITPCPLAARCKNVSVKK